MSKELPQYRVVHERGYFDGAQLIPNGVVITHEGMPGEHLEPVNDAARKMVADNADSETSAPTGMLRGADINGENGKADKASKKELDRLKAEVARLTGELQAAKPPVEEIKTVPVEPVELGAEPMPHAEPVSASGALKSYDGSDPAEIKRGKATGKGPRTGG